MPKLKSAASQLLSSLAQEERNWGDWSDCSERCVKTRHRKNCDDLITANRRPAGAPVRAGSAKPGFRARRQALDELVAAPPGAQDDQDEPEPADAEAELDQVDSCDGLDSSKTLEQKSCVGGQCPVGLQQVARPPPAAAQPARNQLPVAANNNNQQLHQQQQIGELAAQFGNPFGNR